MQCEAGRGDPENMTGLPRSMTRSK